MCGRFALTVPVEAMRQLFGFREQPNFPARYNIAPTQPVAIIRAGGQGREFTFVRWGLLPGWAKDRENFPLLINARSEMAFEKPAFSASIRRRRCLIPADAFYEWQGKGKGPKQPFMIRSVDGGVMAFAAIWEHWTDADGGEIETAAILTCAANDAVTPVHHRMPVILNPEDWAEWLERPEQEAENLKSLLVPTDNEALEIVPISTRVNKVSNDDADIQAQVEVGAIVEKVAKDARPADGQLNLL